jgi:glutamate--cysteine ligase
MGYERWTDYALDVPMYFVKRGDRYIDVAGRSFRDLLAGRLAELPGERATVSDWANHLSTIFPEVRLKRYLEMRGADAGPWARLPSLTAFWVGLLYDDVCLDAAWDMVKGWTAEERQTLRDEVPRLGFRSMIRGRDLLSIAREALALSRGADETRYLKPLEDLADRGETPAEELLRKFYGPWGGSVDRVYAEYAY